MREIKFRAWNKDLNIMVYENEDNSATYLDGWFASDVQVLNQTLNSQYKVEKYEFMQYTGLKDKNGKEIYEGDIVKIRLYNNKYIIKWEQRISSFIIKDVSLLNEDNIKDLEVIGNVYDNPELLEV